MKNNVPQWQVASSGPKQNRTIVDRYIAALFSVTALAFSFLVVTVLNLNLGNNIAPRKDVAPVSNTTAINNVDESMFAPQPPKNVDQDKINSLFPIIKE